MDYQHQELAAGKWKTMTFSEQFANVGSEVERAMNWREKNSEYSRKALERALELLDLTANDEKNKKKLKEIMRVRECLVDYFLFGNNFASSDSLWKGYFYPFNYFARIGH